MSRGLSIKTQLSKYNCQSTTVKAQLSSCTNAKSNILMQGSSVILHDFDGSQKKTELASTTPALPVPTEKPAVRNQDSETTFAVPHSLTTAAERLLKVATPCSATTMPACLDCCSYCRLLHFALALGNAICPAGFQGCYVHL